jgi:hypothetical protein
MARLIRPLRLPMRSARAFIATYPGTIESKHD